MRLSDGNFGTRFFQVRILCDLISGGQNATTEKTNGSERKPSQGKISRTRKKETKVGA